ncbi:hypothetical protein [Paenibacillus sp. JJ1722]|uniref:hypothetical protein n=1 Tax=Paenibacillus sp. JJ1722 TaxID=3398770 RepID=UPI003AAEDEA5
MTLIKLASGSNMLGYYMNHGGSNPVGKKTYMNEQFLPKITGLQAADGEVRESDHAYVIYPDTGKNNGIVFRTAEGKQIRFITLTRQEALLTYRFNLWGQHTVAVSDCPLTVQNG